MFDHDPSTQKLGRFWTVPNVLSLSRILFAAPAAYLIAIRGPFEWTLELILLAIATDWLDGLIARWTTAHSGWGKILDPVADKIGGGLVLVALVYAAQLPLWLLILVLARDLLIVAGGGILHYKGHDIPTSTRLGKLATVTLAITVVAVLLQADPELAQACIYLAAGLAVLSFLQYVRRAYRLIAIPAKPSPSEDAHVDREREKDPDLISPSPDERNT